MDNIQDARSTRAAVLPLSVKKKYAAIRLFFGFLFLNLKMSFFLKIFLKKR
jgi:hypothetical protein